jgi:hypothetical protein
VAIELERIGDVNVITLSGRIVTEVAQDLKSELDAYAAGEPRRHVLRHVGRALHELVPRRRYRELRTETADVLVEERLPGLEVRRAAEDSMQEDDGPLVHARNLR